MNQDILAAIAKASGADEVAELIGEYRAYLGGEEITVKIYDRKIDAPYRYSVHAFVTDDPSRSGFGNPDDTVEHALSVYHWDKLKA